MSVRGENIYTKLEKSTKINFNAFWCTKDKKLKSKKQRARCIRIIGRK